MGTKTTSCVNLSGPGLRKATRGSIRSQRRPNLLRLNEGWVASMFSRADIVSEGAVRQDDGKEQYFGTTSIDVTIAAAAMAAEGHEPERLAQALLADPFTRLHVLRMARREATSRASRSLDVAYSEVLAEASLVSGDLVLLFQIDLNAELLSYGIDDATGT